MLSAFIFPILVCCLGFALTGVYPFGSRSALIIDGVHQYLGFYKELSHQLGSGGDWMFSTHGMGYNFYSVFSYYLSSPFSLLILLLMQIMYVNEAVTIAVLLKIGLSGACMAWYMQKKTNGRKNIAACIGSMYGLSNFILGYYSNLMWLDCLMFLPLLAWCIEELVSRGHWRKYTLVLGYCIISNYYMGFILICFSLLIQIFILCKSAGERRKWKRVLCVFLLGEIGIHGVLSICNNGSANRNPYEESGREIRHMVGTKTDSSLYRTVIVNPILRNEELLFGLNGVSVFSSTNTDHMQNWMKSMGFETGSNRFQYTGGTEVMDMLLGIKYLACRKDMNFDTVYQKTEEGQYFRLFENPRALGNGYLVDPQMKDFSLQGKNPFEVQNHLLEQMGCGPVFQTRTVIPIEQKSGIADTVYELYLDGKEHGYLWLEGREPSAVELNGRIQKPSDWNNNFLDLGYSDKARTVQVKVSAYKGTAVLGTLEERQMDLIYQKLQKNEIRIQNDRGTIQADKDGILFFPVFYDKGIRIRIDGKEAEVLNLDGMTGIFITKGNHEVEFSYRVSGLRAGAAGSVLTLGIIGLSLWMERVRKSKRGRGRSNEKEPHLFTDRDMGR